MTRSFVCVVLAVCCVSCGYVGDPLPPALNIPARVADLTAVERGDKIVVEFTTPALTTEAVVIKKLGTAELQVGDKTVPIAIEKLGRVKSEVPVAGLVGQQPAIRVRIGNERGRFSDWSNQVVLAVVEPLPPLRDVKAEPAPKGVRVSWRMEPVREGATFRVTRLDTKKPVVVNQPEYIDTDTKYGQEYRYEVEAVVSSAESEPSAIASVVPKDIFPPDVPAGVTAVAGINTIELSWDPSTAEDLKGYRVYRSADNGAFQSASDVLETPAFSDKQVQTNHAYKYAITAIDQTGNESARSAPVEIKLQ